MRGSSMIRWALVYKGRFLRAGIQDEYRLFLTRRDAEMAVLREPCSDAYRVVKVKVKISETTERT